MHVPSLRAENTFSPEEMVASVARCWRIARDRGESAQQRLFALLSPHACGVLAPVFDGLLKAWEAALGRRMEVGAEKGLSADESLLADLLEGSARTEECAGIGARGRALLDHALRSTRVMIALGKR